MDFEQSNGPQKQPLWEASRVRYMPEIDKLFEYGSARLPIKFTEQTAVVINQYYEQIRHMDLQTFLVS